MSETNRIEYKQQLTDNFLRMAFPAARQVTPQVTKLLQIMESDMNRQELQEMMGLADRKNFGENYLEPALQQGLIEYTIPGKPTSRLQRYRLTQIGLELKKNA